MSRYARERMPDQQYLESSYYEKWIHGLSSLLVENGVLTENEIEQRMHEISSGKNK